MMKKNQNDILIFKENINIAKRVRKEYVDKLSLLENTIKDVYNNTSYDEDTKNFIVLVIDILYCTELRKNITRLNTEIALMDGKTLHGQYDLSAIKAIPIEDLHSFEKARKTTSRITAKCPFHDEKQPSFVIYRNTNTFHCFSCKSSGDNISFLMKLHNTDFNGAVQCLKKT